MVTQLGGYEDNASGKGSGLREVTTTEVEDKAYLDVKLYDNGELDEAEEDYNQLDQTQILSNMLKELKKINLHLSILTDNTIKNTEVE